MSDIRTINEMRRILEIDDQQSIAQENNAINATDVQEEGVQKELNSVEVIKYMDKNKFPTGADSNHNHLDENNDHTSISMEVPVSETNQSKQRSSTPKGSVISISSSSFASEQDDTSSLSLNYYFGIEMARTEADSVSGEAPKASNEKTVCCSAVNETKQSDGNQQTREMACKICDEILVNYVIACDHYKRNHGRNVLMCPYCGQHFFQSRLLRKHVLAEHSKDEKQTMAFDQPSEPTNDSEATPEHLLEQMATTTENELPNELIQTTDDVDQSNDAPLNLCISKNIPIDLSLKNWNILY